jgi:dTDP-4-amino-4,6-dideoxygalactose transaminase
MFNMSFVDLKSQYDLIRERINFRIENVLEHGQYIMGPEVFELERQLSEYVGVKHVKTCANGTDALVIALMTLNIGKGDAVYCPTFTFFATAEAISLVGATPVFIDCEDGGFNICQRDLEVKINKTVQETELKPKAIIAVDLFGLPANYPEIRKVASKYNLKIIEDAAQSFGGKIGEKFATSFGDISTTSFFPAKPLGCYGDGGALFTNNDEYAAIIESLRVHGKGVNKYNNVRIGMNSRLDTIQAAILLEKLPLLEAEIQAREHLVAQYNSSLDVSVIIPSIPAGFRSAWAQYTILVEDRASFKEWLQSKNIPSAIYYDPCVHQQPVYSSINSSCENAERIAQKCISLPLQIYKDFPNLD